MCYMTAAMANWSAVYLGRQCKNAYCLIKASHTKPVEMFSMEHVERESQTQNAVREMLQITIDLLCKLSGS